MLAAALAAVVPGAGGVLEIQSGSDCPGAAAVQAQLQHLMPDAGGGLVDIRRADADGRVELLLYSDQQSGPLRRLLPVPAAAPGCAQLAQLAAVVIATWQATVPRPAPRPPEPAPPPRIPPPRVHVDVSAAVLGALAGTQLALAQQLDLRLSAGRRFGVRIGALLPAPHTLELGRGRAAWTRWGLRVQPGVVLTRGRLVLELAATAALALLDVAGEGFEYNRRAFAPDFGLGGGARIGFRHGRIWPFVGIEAAGWLAVQRVRGTYTDAMPEAALPRLDLLFSAGVALDDRRAAQAL